MTEMEIMRRRVEIECRMERCRDTAAESIVEIGRLLNAAKDENVVPHGEWTAWVSTHAGMNERTAQRVMRIARELPEGSPLATLGIAKLSSLLTLPAGEREAAAAEMDAEHLTTREVDERVRAIRAQRDEALRLVGEQKKKQQEQQAEVDRLSGLLESANIGQKRTSKLLGEAEGRADDWRRETEALRRETEKLRQEADGLRARMRESAERVRKETEAAVEGRMREQLDRANAARKALEREIDNLSEQLDEAQTAAMRGSMSGDGGRSAPGTRILSAIGALMAEAGNAPGELAHCAGMDAETEQLLIGQARLLGQWAMQIIAACGGDMHA